MLSFKPPYAIGSESRVYRVTQLRTDGVRCRESAGTGPVVLKAARATGSAFSGTAMNHFLRASLISPALGTKDMCDTRQPCIGDSTH